MNVAAGMPTADCARAAYAAMICVVVLPIVAAFQKAC
jgi:hypothetical protein